MEKSSRPLRDWALLSAWLACSGLLWDWPFFFHALSKQAGIRGYAADIPSVKPFATATVFWIIAAVVGFVVAGSPGAVLVGRARRTAGVPRFGMLLIFMALVAQCIGALLHANASWHVTMMGTRMYAPLWLALQPDVEAFMGRPDWTQFVAVACTALLLGTMAALRVRERGTLAA